MTTVRKTLAQAAAELTSAGIDGARLDAEVLLAHALRTSRSGLLMRLRDPLDGDVAAEFSTLVQRRLRREPVAYSVGGREFWSLWFETTPATLIPRPETELVVAAALGRISRTNSPRVLDVGTGSGCIAVAIAHERTDAALTAIDVSAGALAVARRNASAHAVCERIQFRCEDFRTLAEGESYDLIVSNPPYVRSGDLESLPPDVGRFEPSLALDGGEDGLLFVRSLCARAPRLLAPKGALVLEVGSDQGESAISLARAAGFGEATVRDDYAGLPRVLIAGACAASTGRGVEEGCVTP